MLNILNGTINGKKECLFLRAQSKKKKIDITFMTDGDKLIIILMLQPITDEGVLFILSESIKEIKDSKVNLGSRKIMQYEKRI